MNYLFSNHLFMVRVTDFCGLFIILIYFFCIFDTHNSINPICISFN